MSALRARTTAARRQAILDAALPVFLAHGVAGASIDEIRMRSGASIGSIYHHFDGKQGIAAALYLEALASYQRGSLATLRPRRSARAGVEAVVRHHLDWVAAHPDLARYLLASREAEVALASERLLRELNGAFFAAVADWVRPHVARGALRDLRPDLFHALWLGPSQELARSWLAGRTTGRLERAAPTLAAAAWRSLKPEED